MYEFLAPWGVLAPVVSFLLTYTIVMGKRRAVLRKQHDGPDPAVESLSTTVTSYRLFPPLSKGHG